MLVVRRKVGGDGGRSLVMAGGSVGGDVACMVGMVRWRPGRR